MNELQIHQEQALTARDIQAQVNRIQEVMKAVMKKDVHYGVIPGTPKPTLYKPGAEKIMATFKLAALPNIEDLSGPDSIRYRVSCMIQTINSALIVGTGVGECSTDEEKYRWRKSFNDAEYDETPEDRRRMKWKRYNGREYQEKQIRTVPSDLANTVLKMAKKRALIDAVLTATAASDIFSQDIEELPEELREAASETHPEIKQPQEKKPEPAKDQNKETAPPADGKKGPKETLTDELREYVMNTKDPGESFKLNLKTITGFEGKNGWVDGKDDIDALSDKWAGSALKTLRERVEKGIPPEEAPF